MLSRPWAQVRRRQESSRSAPSKIAEGLSLLCAIPGPVFTRRSLRRFFKPFTLQRRAEQVWGCRSVVPSSRPMGGGSGQKRTLPAELRFCSHCRAADEIRSNHQHISRPRKGLDLTMPPSLLARVDEVIEYVANVRYWPKADLGHRTAYVRFPG